MSILIWIIYIYFKVALLHYFMYTLTTGPSVHCDIILTNAPQPRGGALECNHFAHGSYINFHVVHCGLRSIAALTETTVTSVVFSDSVMLFKIYSQILCK